MRALAGDLLRADRDPPTGLLNRRAFRHNALGMILARRGTDAHLLVLSVDLDNFKALNDDRGHAAGDHALVQVAQAMLTAADNQAVVARSGGEEFLLAGTRRPATLRRWLPERAGQSRLQPRESPPASAPPAPVSMAPHPAIASHFSRR
ncbi:MAG: GGDEF domain-containing protein [Mycobacterium sp.]